MKLLVLHATKRVIGAPIDRRELSQIVMQYWAARQQQPTATINDREAGLRRVQRHARAQVVGSREGREQLT